ncbi:MAG TPA: glycosyltransferase [Mycobacteriales bacterium]|jgi:GT2 family glycosyltransferase|nr:glycosyltransferase [Mycobacteriales bacterium]
MTATPPPSKVVAVVVTFNRRELLLECLASIEAQTRPVAEIIVVDNASSDGTPAAIAEHHPEVTLFELPTNLGGAGGFAFGVAAARPHAGQIWLMDDDAAPLPDALEQLLAARGRYPGPTPAILASRVISTDGQPIPMNVPRERPFVSAKERSDAAEAGCMPIRSASFVSVLVDGLAARRNELPVADYFIWNDDFEYTARLLRSSVGLLCPDSVTRHAAKPLADPGARMHFEVRNKIWLWTRSSALSPRERLAYGGSTVRRWMRWLLTSSNRLLLLRGLITGTAEAVRHGPRPTAAVLEVAHKVTATGRR